MSVHTVCDAGDGDLDPVVAHPRLVRSDGPVTVKVEMLIPDAGLDFHNTKCLARWILEHDPDSITGARLP